MLAVELNRANYEYDVHSLVKAFYPEEQVSVLTSEMGEAKRESLKADIRIRILKNAGRPSGWTGQITIGISQRIRNSNTDLNASCTVC